MKPKDINILIGCEESQAVCIAFRERGFNAYSCDLLDCSGGNPEWHIKGDVLELLKKRLIIFRTQDKKLHIIWKWHLGIFHPECTYLSNVGIKHFDIKIYGEKAIKRIELRKEAFEFFMNLYNCNINHIAVENPVGYINSKFRKSDQIIHPYYFGDPYQKRTCLWLRNLPLLKYNETQIKKPKPLYICKGEKSKGKKINWVEGISGYSKEERKRMRSKTFPGIAKAIAIQYGDYLLKELSNKKTSP